MTRLFQYSPVSVIVRKHLADDKFKPLLHFKCPIIHKLISIISNFFTCIADDIESSVLSPSSSSGGVCSICRVKCESLHAWHLHMQLHDNLTHPCTLCHTQLTGNSYTPYSKRKYILCFPSSTQNVG